MTATIDEHVELPPIFCPLDGAVNPARDEVERQAVAWIDASGFCAGDRERACVVGTHSADFYARFAPHAPAAGLLPAALWVYWGFAFDDARCDAGRLSDRPAEFLPMASMLHRALERPGPAPADDAYACALHDIADRFRTIGTPVQFQRFVAAHRAWLQGVAWQIANQQRGYMPDLEEYVTMRLHSAGGEPTYAMLEIANGAEVPAAEMDAPAVRALTEMAILTAALDNDRHSLVRELDEPAGQNIYTVLMRCHDRTPREAVRQATGLRDRVFTRFLDLRAATSPRLSAAGRTYVDGLAYGIRGNAEWGLRVPRYVSRGEMPGPADEDPIVWAERPLDPSPEPVPLATTAWWWDPSL